MAKDGFAEIAHAASLNVQGPRLEDTPRVITASGNAKTRIHGSVAKTLHEGSQRWVSFTAGKRGTSGWPVVIMNITRHR